MMRKRSIACLLLATLAVVAGITLVHETAEAHQHLDGCHFCISVGHWLPGDPSPLPIPGVHLLVRQRETPESPPALSLVTLPARAPPVPVPSR